MVHKIKFVLGCCELHLQGFSTRVILLKKVTWSFSLRIYYNRIRAMNIDLVSNKNILLRFKFKYDRKSQHELIQKRSWKMQVFFYSRSWKKVTLFSKMRNVKKKNNKESIGEYKYEIWWKVLNDEHRYYTMNWLTMKLVIKSPLGWEKAFNNITSILRNTTI